MATGNAPAVRITVVIPTYNRAAVIGEALETVFAQTYPVHEIIVVDDASSDATCYIVRGFDDPRIKLIARQENAGGGAACFDGIAEAQGDFIDLLDSADLWVSEKLAHQVERRVSELTSEAERSCLCYTHLREDAEGTKSCVEGK